MIGANSTDCTGNQCRSVALSRQNAIVGNYNERVQPKRRFLHGVALLLEPDGLEGSKMKEANATDEMQARISGLKDQGVAFNVCANTLKGRKVDTADLYDFSEADVVPSGVAELAHLQAQGYTYIKP